MAKPQLTVKDCSIVIRKHLNTDDVTVSGFSLTEDSGENFELKIQANHPKIFAFFVKTSSNVSKIYDILDSIKEVKISPVPKLYHTKPNCIIFEDLKPQGFRNHDGSLNLDHLLVVLKALAKLHSASFIVEEVKSKTRKFRLDVEYALLHLNFNVNKPEVSKLISSLLENEGVFRAIEDLEERQFCLKFRKSLCHGNLTAGNIMFKYDKGAPEDCKLLNTKSNFYAPPIYDVLQLIFFNTSEDSRQQYLHTLLLQYFEFLKEELTQYNLDITKIVPIEDLLLGVHHFLPLIKLEAVLHQQKSECLVSLQESLTCPLLSREDCYVIIKNKIGTTNYDFVSFQVTPLGDVSGFLGEYHRLQINIRYLFENKTINCFIKSAPRSGAPQVIAKELETFSREAFMYQILVPQMKKYEINTIDECLPPCYFHRPEEFMVFEDMHLLNYKNVDALEPLNFTCVSILIRKLARFHSCSIILEQKVSEELQQPYRLLEAYREYFNEPLFFEHETHVGARQFMVGVKSVLAAVDLIPEIKTETNQKNFHNFWPQFKDLFYTVIKTSDRFRNVLCHGDLWTSNTLIKFEDQKPTDCTLIDFQIVRYCPPAYDILSVLHLTTDRSTRLRHEQQLLKIYYEELTQNLKSSGYSVASIYPYEDFISCVTYMKPQMIMQAAIDCVLTMCTPEEISSFLTDEEKSKYVYYEDRTEFMTSMCQKSDRYRTRLKECLLDIYDFIDSVCYE